MSADALAPWLDIDGYAALLGVGRTTVRDLVAARRIRFSKVGRHVRFSPEDRAANTELLAHPPAKAPSFALVPTPKRTTRRAS